MGPVIVTAPGGQTQRDPIGGSITGASKTAWIDESFQQMDRVLVKLLPVRRDHPGHATQKMTGQIRNLDPGNNEKKSVVGDAPKIALAQERRPTDEPIPSRQMPRSR